MRGYGFYTTEGVPLYIEGSISELGLSKFADKYGTWSFYAPGIVGGEPVCYVGARFDNVKESILGRPNRVVLLLLFDTRDELTNVWKLFNEDNFRKLVERSGLVFDDELEVSRKVLHETGKLPTDVVEKIQGEVRSYMKGLEEITSLKNAPLRRVEIEGLTDLRYPSLYHRELAIGAILKAIHEISSGSCMPDRLELLLRKSMEELGEARELVYPLVMYSQASAPYLGGLWLSRG